MAIQTEPTRIQIPFADSGTKNVIPDTNSTPSASQAASWTDGFPAQCSLPLSAGGIPPARADFNGILNAMTQSIRYGQEGGVWTWSSAVDYAANRMVLGSDGLLYWSVAQSGPNLGGAHDPTTDTGVYWQAPHAKTVSPQDNSSAIATTMWVNSAVLGVEIYVDGTNGSDTNDGLSLATAVKTINKAISLGEKRTGNAIAITVAGGTYTENIETFNRFIYFNLPADIVINGHVYVSDGGGAIFSGLSITINSTDSEALKVFDNGFFYSKSDVIINRTGATATDIFFVSTNALALFSGNLSLSGGNANSSLRLEYNSHVRVLGNISISDTGRSGKAIWVYNESQLCVGGDVSCSIGNDDTISIIQGGFFFVEGSVSLSAYTGRSGIYLDSKSFASLQGLTVSGSANYAVSVNNLSYFFINLLFDVAGSYSGCIVFCSGSSEFLLNSAATVTGSPTGQRFNCASHSLMVVYGAGVNRIPGDSAGYVDSTSYAYYG